MGPLQEYSTSLTFFPLPPAATVGPVTAKVPVFTYGLDERDRTEDWNPPFDFNNASAGPGGKNQHEQLRLRTRIWGTLSAPHSDVQLNVKLTNEMNKSIYTHVKLNDNEIFFDQLNIKFNKTFIKGLTFQAGRMDWIKGDGFMFMDGTGGDGSRASYYNMVNIAYTHKKSQLEVVGILNPRLEHLFPLVHNQKTALDDWNDQAIGLYYTDRNRSNTDIDAYYMLKKEIKDPRAATNSLFQPNKHTNTIGARILHRMPNGLSIKGEGALQFDAVRANPAQTLKATSWTAFAGYVTVTKQFLNTPGKPFVEGGYTVLSGSDQQKDGVGFDPLFSRWPRYSELYAYSLVNEKGISYLSNDGILTLEAGVIPVKKIVLRAALYQHNAFKSINAFSPTVFGTGTNRGENLQLRSDILLSKNWIGHILYEKWWAGNFYAHQDPAYFFRGEVTYTFRGKVGAAR
ncbi:MAG: alginate export family protein [Acidobacteriota bacterium]|nr:alginate export family protein [Acidobacteriota bacterium]